MKVVITGASGRVGSRLASELITEGHQVVGIDRAPGRIEEAGYRHVQCAFDDPAMAGAFEGAQAVLHLGAFMSWVPEDGDAVWRSGVNGTRAVLSAAADAGVSRVIFASSGEVYPELFPQYLPIDEDHPTEPRSMYGLTKLMGEQLTWFYARTRGLDATVLRFSHTQDASELLDPNSFFSGPRFFLRGRIRQQEAFGNQQNVARLTPHDDGTEKLLLSCNEAGEPFRMGIMETRDIAAGVRAALADPAAIGKTFNLCPDKAVDFDSVLEAMATITGLPVVRVNFPGPGVRYETSNARIREALGFRPAWPFERMLEEAGRHWQTNHRHAS
ncbi:MAG: NAD(P)-dependent oxidoreductase [Devosia sp.]